MPANTNPLSYNQYIANIGVLAVYSIQSVGGVNQFIDTPIQLSVPNMLNYAELRIQRDLDFLSSQSSNTYPVSPSTSLFSISVNDFLTVQTIEVVTGGGVSTPLLPISKEFIQNIYGGGSTTGTPQYFAMYGDNFGGTGDSVTNILFGPPTDVGYTFKITGTSRLPSIYQFSVVGIADTSYTYISAYYPDLLTLASMIYITMLQRNFGAVGDTPEMGMTYEKQYQMARIGAIAEENRRKQMGSSWSAYSTPVSATATR